MTRPRRPSLATLYADLNAQFWQGALVPTLPRGLYVATRYHRAVVVQRRGFRTDGAGLCSGFLQATGCSRALGLFRPPGQFRPAHIHVMSPLAREEERQTLLHEMVHCYLYFAGFPAEGHGPRFIAELERLASRGEAWAAEEATRWVNNLVGAPPRS